MCIYVFRKHIKVQIFRSIVLFDLEINYWQLGIIVIHIKKKKVIKFKLVTCT